LIIGLDVGSVRRPGGFAWATADETRHGQDDPSALGAAIFEALSIGRKVALAVECPLAVPVPEPSLVDWIHLGRARSGEGNRSWSAGAGTGALATGLVQLAWLCSFIQTRSHHAVRATTQLGKFLTEDFELFLCEAMVTSDGKPEAVTELQDHLVLQPHLRGGASACVVTSSGAGLVSAAPV